MVNMSHLFILATTQASDCIMDHRSRGTLHYHQKTSLKAARLLVYGLHGTIEVA
jgi:hypothetical protein